MRRPPAEPPSRRSVWVPVASAACALLLATAPVALAKGGGHRHGHGAAPDARPELGIVTQTDTISRDEVRRMRRAHVESVRFTVPWGRVDPSGADPDWTLVDQRVLAAAHARATTMLTVFGSPSRYGSAMPPTASAAEMRAWLAFLHELVTRYGPGGTFMQAHPGIAPVRRWQIWNEPNLSAFWGYLEPSPSAYVRLLDRSASEIYALDPGASVISAGLSPAARDPQADQFLRGMYATWQALGERPSYDELALHPYSNSVRKTKALVKASLEVARNAGHRRVPVVIGEVAWGSAGPRGYPLAGTPASQVHDLESAYRMFERKAKAWHLASVYWYALRDLPHDVHACGFCDFTGLLDAAGRPKPAWKAFRRVLKGGRK